MPTGVRDEPDSVSAPLETARRQYLAIIFCDLSDSTRLGAAMEAEHYAEMLGDIRRAYREVIPRHGGTIVRIQGDGMLAIFGYPDPREDDGRRAAEAALDLHDAVCTLRVRPVADAPVALSLHTGIHSGLVLVDEGDLVRGRFELLGNAPNIAARLSAAAQRGEILVSEETLGAERHFFETSERLYLSLKGRAEPLAAYRILRRGPVSTRFEARTCRGLVAFVGRERELGMLDALLREVAVGRTRHAVIRAPAGLGKTRLAEEFLRRAAAAGCQLHRGYCESYLSAEPLQPFLQMLRSLFGIEHGMDAGRATALIDSGLAAAPPELAAHRATLLHALSLGGASSPAASVAPAADSIVIALRDLFDRLAAAQPLLLFVDDWQWADDATRQAFGAICANERRAILVMTATRPTASGDTFGSDTTVIDLQPFDDAEAAHTIMRLLPGADPFVAADIRKYSGGNALFIEELCHSVAHDRADRRLARLHEGGAWLDSLIESRVARLPRVQQHVVRAAAIIGTVIPVWLLEAIIGFAAGETLVRELADQDFIFASDRAGTLRFKHGITRDVVYAAVGLHERRAMHLRVAIATRERGGADGPEIYEALAYHYGAGGSAAEAAHYAELAGDKAMRASALDRAQLQYRAALEALDPQSPAPDAYARWMSIAHRLGLVCVFDPSRDHLDLLERAVDVATARGDTVSVAQSQYWLGYIQYGLGEPRIAIDHCERALKAAGAQAQDPLSVQIRAALGQAQAASGDYAQAMPLLDEAIAIKRRHRSGSRPAVGLSYTLACKAGVLGDCGLFDQAHAVFDEATDAVRGSNHGVEASVLGWRSLVYLWQGRWREALDASSDAQHMAERVRSCTCSR